MNKKIKITIIKLALSILILLGGVFIKTAISMAIGHNIIIVLVVNALVLFPAIGGIVYVWKNYPFRKKDLGIGTNTENNKNEQFKWTIIPSPVEANNPGQNPSPTKVVELSAEKQKLDVSQNLNPSPNLTYKADLKFNFSYSFGKIAKYCGVVFILIILINGLSYLFSNKFLIPWNLAFLLPLLLLIIDFLNGDSACPANKVIIDIAKRTIFLNYTSHYFIKRKYHSGFDDLKINVSKKRSGDIEKITFFKSGMEEICYIDLREELFSEGTFIQLSHKLDELTFYKNIV